MEVAAGLEPAKTGFADQRLDRFGMHAREAQDGESGGREVIYPKGGTGRRGSPIQRIRKMEQGSLP